MNIHVEIAKTLGLSYEKYAEIFKTEELLRNLDGALLKSVYRFRKCLERLSLEGSSDRIRPKIENLYISQGFNKGRVLNLVRPLLQDLLADSEKDRMKKASNLLDAVANPNQQTEVPGILDNESVQRKIQVHKAITADGIVRSSENASVYNLPKRVPSIQQESNSIRKSKVISFVNCKSGVGKSSTLVQLAEVLAFESGKRVLVIDANFNADVSLSLIGDFRVERLESEGATLTRLYRDYSEGSDYFDLNASIQRRVSNIYIATLDLIVSGIGLEKMIEQCTSEQIHGSLVSLIQKIKNQYDYILIDTPNQKGSFLEEALLASDYFCFITRPDNIGTYFLADWVESISKLAKSSQSNLKCLGLILNQYDETSSLHNKVKRDLSDRFRRMFSGSGLSSGPVFQSSYPLVDTLKTTMLFHRQEPKTVKEKYGIGKMGGKSVYPILLDIAGEFIKRAL